MLVIFSLAGCSSWRQARAVKKTVGPARVQTAPEQIRLDAVPELDAKKMTIAVYNFLDKTGQRKPADKIANLSSAVTQGSEVWVIKALQEVGNGTWFEVVERVGSGVGPVDGTADSAAAFYRFGIQCQMPSEYPKVSPKRRARTEACSMTETRGVTSP